MKHKNKVLSVLIICLLFLCAPLASAEEASLPCRYDLRDEGYCTCAKAQDPWGSCWAFGSVASIESNLMKQGLLGSDADLSERHLVWFSATPLDSTSALSQPSALADSAHSQEGEGQQILDGQDISPFDLGAFDYTAGALLASGVGPVQEKDFPYTNNQGDIDNYYIAGNLVESVAAAGGDWSVKQEDRFKKSDFRLKANELLPNPIIFDYMEDGERKFAEYDEKATVEAKKALMEHGALVLSYAADASLPGEEHNSECFNYDTWAQYRDEVEYADHTVAIIGWDDNYSKENFENQAIREDRASLPKADGAWIVKNSWGSKDGGSGNTYDWGVDGSGCFYLSYYDKSIESIETFQMQEAKEDLDVCMQYDFLGMDSFDAPPLVFDDEVEMANVFVAPYDMDIKEVTCASHTPNPQVDISIVLLPADAQDPEDGIVMAEAQESWKNAGYHTVELEEPVQVAKGDKFSVIETLSVDDGVLPGYELSVEKGYTQDYFEDEKSDEVGNEEQLEIQNSAIAVAKINKGESYYKFSGQDWLDCTGLDQEEDLSEEGITYGNVCIKTFGSKIDGGGVATYEEVEAEYFQTIAIGFVVVAGIVVGVVVLIKKKKKKNKDISEVSEEQASLDDEKDSNDVVEEDNLDEDLQ